MIEVALEYFRGLSAGEKRKLLKKLVASLSEQEKSELAEMLVNKK
jgi:hypothetical protein